MIDRRTIGDVGQRTLPPDSVPLKPPQLGSLKLNDALGNELNDEIVQNGNVPSGVSGPFVKRVTGFPSGNPGIVGVPTNALPSTPSI